MLDTYGRQYVQFFLEKVADFFIKRGFSANQVTILSLGVGLVVPVLYIGQLAWGAVLFLWLSGLLDATDGTIARKTNTSSYQGTLMDIFFDRVVEVGVILALAWVHQESCSWLIVLCCSIILSMTVFLTVGALVAKKGVKTFYYQAGLAERTEGFVVFSLMMLFNNYLVILTLIFAGLILITAGQRMAEGMKLLR